MSPPPRPERGSDDDGGAETYGSRDCEPGRRRPENDHRIVRGNVDVLRIHGLDFDVLTHVHNCVVGIRAQIAVIVGTLAKLLDGIHYIGALERALRCPVAVSMPYPPPSC